MNLRMAKKNEVNIAMDFINEAKTHLQQQGIDQWQSGYPDYHCIQQDIENEKGFFIADEDILLGYLCIDYDGEAAYSSLNSEWQYGGKYVVVHRMAFSQKARGKGISNTILYLVEEMSRQKGYQAFRVDTDADNMKMQHILMKNGFVFRGTIWFDNSEKIAFEKSLI